MTYILRRVLALIPIKCLTWTAVFIVFESICGDPVNLMLSGVPASEEVIANERARLGLDKHVWERYLHYIGRAAVVDLGDSYRTRQPVTQGLDLSVTPGNTLAVLGESRSGKSVTALAIMGLNRFSGGRLVDVSDLTARFNVAHDPLGRPTHRVHSVELVSSTLQPGETLAFVRKFGSGKSTVGKALQQPVVSSAGEIAFEGRACAAVSPAESGRLKRDIHCAHRIAAMYLGQIVEIGSRLADLGALRHPYTQKLLNSVTVRDPRHRPVHSAIRGEVPSAIRRAGDAPTPVRLVECAAVHWAAEV